MPLDAGTRRIIEVLRRGEEVEYGFLGVTMSGTGPDKYVRLQDVIEGGPARRAELRPGEYLLSINGTPVHTNDDLFLQIGMSLAGSSIRVEVAPTPAGPRRTCVVKLAKYAVPGQIIASRRPAPRGGLRVDYTSTIFDPYDLRHRGILDGVVVREVVPHSPADNVRLQPYMVITRVNNHLVMTPAEFYQEMDRAAGPVDLTFLNAENREERVTLNSSK
jgi:serine protease Do